MSRVKDAFMSGGYAGNGSIILSSTYTKEPVILIALYIDDGNHRHLHPAGTPLACLLEVDRHDAHPASYP